MTDQENVIKYLASMKLIEGMLKNGIIDEKSHEMMSTFYAKKYCIKRDDLYRQDSLTLEALRVMYIHAKEAEENGKKDD